MTILLAGAALTPAVAHAQDDGDGRRGHVRGEARGQEGRGNVQRSEGRSEQRAARAEARQEQVRSAPAQVQVADQGGRRGGWRGGRGDGNDNGRGGWRGGRGDNNDNGGVRAEGSWRGRDNDGGQTSSGYQRGWQGPAGTENSEIARRYDQRARENAARYGTPEQRREAYRDGRRNGDWRGNGRDWRQERRGDRRDWDRGWRNDRRYAWQDWRYRNRGLFHLSPYYSPYRNYRYQRFSIGLFLDELFFDQRYWIGDPFYYRLPPAPPGTQWVRYYNDVLLVDVYSGEVIDAIYDFFW